MGTLPEESIQPPPHCLLFGPALHIPVGIGECQLGSNNAVAHLRSEGKIVPDDLLAHTSPVGWEHIAFSGDFLWDRAATATGRKPLNLTGKQRAA